MTTDGPLLGKFRVTRTDGRSGAGEKHVGCDYFVLDLTHDPYSRDALVSYIDACEVTHPQLAESLRMKLLATVQPNDGFNPMPFCTTNEDGDIAYFEGHCSPERAVEIVMYWAEKDGWLPEDNEFDQTYMRSNVSLIYLDGAALANDCEYAGIVEASHPHAEPWTQVRF
jgi:hypothetical protein